MASYGLLGQGRQFKGEAMQGLSDVSRIEENREQQNKSLRNAKKQQEMSSMGTGATTGAMIGAEYGTAAGPWGALIGAGIGLVAGWLLS